MSFWLTWNNTASTTIFDDAAVQYAERSAVAIDLGDGAIRNAETESMFTLEIPWHYPCGLHSRIIKELEWL